MNMDETMDHILANFESRITRPNDAALGAARARWNAVAKPIASLGMLETIIERVAALTGSADVSFDRRAVVVMCADNGVFAQGVSQCEQGITTLIAGSIARGTSSVCSMCAPAGIDAIPVDIGMATPSDVPGVIDLHIARGTADISCGPAMTREQALEAIHVGIGLVERLKADGYSIIASGEMSIGNTTTSSAMTAAFFGLPPEEVTGRGAGLSDAGLQRKLSAIKRAIDVNHPDPDDALDVLSKLGGFDIAGLVGLFIGGALYRVPVIIDGFISALAAYTAMRLVPSSSCAMIASHVSSEPAAKMILDEIGAEPVIQAGMHLGEGTGAVCLIPMLDMALALYNGTTFEQTGMDAYEVDPQD